MIFKTNPQPGIKTYISTSPQRWDGAVIIFPGGGYSHHAKHEGEGYAEFLQEHGISSFVVTYRVVSNGRHPDMIEDALYSVEYARRVCTENGLCPDKVGVMGSSAGGHLAAHAISAWKEYDSQLRPAFGVLCYPVIDLVGECAHEGSRNNLLGNGASDELATTISAHHQVHANTSPVFMWHTGEDQCVPLENSLLMAQALRKHDIAFEMHLYHQGGHGLGLQTEHSWGDAAVKWIRAF